MEFYEAVRRRRMVRNYRDEPVDAAAVERIVDAGRRAPSAGFSQGVSFVVVTDRRALGLSPFVGGFFTEPIRSGERIEEIDATGNFATVLTHDRLLTFRSPSGSWEERNRNLR